MTYAAIADWFEHPAPDDWPNGEARACEKRHGRLTQWQIETSTALNEYLEWPDLAQVFKITGPVTSPKTGQTRTHTRYGITSLSPQQTSPANLLAANRLAFTRRHWAIENSLHWVRDVTFAEDRSTLHVGRTHQVMAILRNLALSLLHLHGFFHIASTVRRFAANPALAIAFVALPLHLGK